MSKRYAAVLLLSPALAIAAAPADIAARRDQQAQVQSETEQLARRIGTMLRVLEHYKLDSQEEKKLLDEAAGTLAGLSKEQMQSVLEKLDAAAASADAVSAQQHLDAAYAGHREALKRLRGLLAHYDAIHNLDQAAARLEKLSRDQVEISFRTADIVNDSVDAQNIESPRRRFRTAAEFPTTRARREAEEQSDYCSQIVAALGQLSGLKTALPFDQRERLAKADAMLKSKRLGENLAGVLNLLRSDGDMARRQRDWLQASATQWTAAGDLQELSQSLLPPRDRVLVLRDARHKLAGLIDEHSRSNAAALELFARPPATPEPVPVRQFAIRIRPMQLPEDPILSRTREFADAEGRLAHSVRGLMLAVTPHATGPVPALERAVRSMQAANAALRQSAPVYARLYQAWAEAQLRQALNEIDLALIQAQRERSDPLAATNSAIQKLDQLIKEQTLVHEQTEQLTPSKNNPAAKELAPQQQDLAGKAADLAKLPLAEEKTKQSLKDASQAMKSAGEKLAKSEPRPAAEHQNEALAKLEEAKAALDAHAKAIEERREDIVSLAEAQGRLDELTKAEQKIAADAKDTAAEKPDLEKVKQQAKDLAKDLEKTTPQKDLEKITPQAKDLAKDLDKLKPDDVDKLSKELEKLTPQAKDLAKDLERLKPEAKDLAKDLEKLTPEAKELAKNLERLAPQEKNSLQAKDLAKEQEKLTPPTENLAKDLEKPAPDASKAAKEAAEKMNAAKNEFQKEKAKDGAQQAEAAAKDLEKAQDALAKALKDKVAQEAIEQAKLQPKEIDPLQAALDVTKAIEAADAASQASEKAAQNPTTKELAKNQQDLADRAKQAGQDKAGQTADKAAQELESGDLENAVAEQRKALEQLQKGDNAQFSQQQKDLMDATSALAKSQMSNELAKSAVQQAKAQSPDAVLSQLDQAAQQLAKATEQLQQSQPKQASKSQADAAQSLTQALATLEAAADALAQNPQPGEPNPGKDPNQQPGKNDQNNPAQEQNENRANGDRLPDGVLKNAKADSNGMDGDGSFLHLPARQRELIRQAMTEKLPPDYAALIQQYYVNVARGKPASKPEKK